jgi:hypothetical protein
VTDERAMSHDETPQVTEDSAASSFVVFPDVKAVPIVDCGLVHRYNMRAEYVTFHSVSLSVRRDLTRRRRRRDQRAGIYETCDVTGAARRYETRPSFPWSLKLARL